VYWSCTTHHGVFTIDKFFPLAELALSSNKQLLLSNGSKARYKRHLWSESNGLQMIDPPDFIVSCIQFTVKESLM
jgi:hypothetical protein